MVGNLPSDRRQALDALLTHVVHSIDMLDLVSPDNLSLEVWAEARDDVNDAFEGKCTSVELAALADGCTKFDVPKQFLFDTMIAADSWIRTREFQSWDDLSVFATRLGGSAMAASVPILGFVKPGYEEPALRLGQALFLTQVVANAANNLKLNNHFLAKDDMEDCEVDRNRMILRQHTVELSHLVRLYCDRIEKLYHEGGHLLEFLDFDGVRSVKALLAFHWKILNKLKFEPALCLSKEGVLTKREILGLRSRHMLGLEVQLPFIQEVAHH